MNSRQAQPHMTSPTGWQGRSGYVGYRRCTERPTSTKRNERDGLSLQSKGILYAPFQFVGFRPPGRTARCTFSSVLPWYLPTRPQTHIASSRNAGEKKNNSCCVFVSKVRGKGRRDCHSGGELGGLRALGRVTIHAYREKGNRWTRVSGCVVND